MPDVKELCVLITGAGDSVGRDTAEKFLTAGIAGPHALLEDI